MSNNFFNRLGNVINRYQTPAKRVLCLCSAGLLRSPTMANVLHQEYGYNTRAAGVTKEYALIPVDEVLIAWSEEIVCVNADVYDELMRQWGEHIPKYDTKVTTLDIPDRYEWNHPELRMSIIDQYKHHVEEEN